MASSCVRVSTFLLIVLLCCYNSSGAVLPRAYTSVLSRSINPTTLAHLAPPSLPSTTTSDAAISPAASSLPSVRASIDREVPFVSRVSGCVDEADRTYECPIRTSLDLTMYGLNFQRAAVTITFTDGGTVVPCTDVRVSTDERLRCHFNTGEVRPQRREMLSVVVNSSLGSSTFDAAVDVNEKVMQPTIVEASGCMDSGTQTQDCRSSSEVRLTGAHYPRWLTPSLIISGKLSLPCQWKGEVWGVYCSLSDRRVDDLPTGQLLPVQVRFADDRISEPEYALAMYSNSPTPPQPPSSTGRPPPVAVDNDDLQPVKLTLFVLCVLSLVAIMGGIAVWGFGLWAAHRRSFVSANGQAAVDTRQLLLH